MWLFPRTLAAAHGTRSKVNVVLHLCILSHSSGFYPPSNPNPSVASQQAGIHSDLHSKAVHDYLVTNKAS